MKNLIDFYNFLLTVLVVNNEKQTEYKKLIDSNSKVDFFNLLLDDYYEIKKEFSKEFYTTLKGYFTTIELINFINSFDVYNFYILYSDTDFYTNVIKESNFDFINANLEFYKCKNLAFIIFSNENNMYEINKIFNIDNDQTDFYNCKLLEYKIELIEAENE